MARTALLALALMLIGSAASAQPTPAQRQACEQDYFRLCQHVGTEESAARQCLIRNMRRLNPTCRSAFQRRKKG
jgi:hypothetical protein